MTDLVERLLATPAKPLSETDLPVFPKHWPYDETAIEAAKLIKKLQEQLSLKCGSCNNCKCSKSGHVDSN